MKSINFQKPKIDELKKQFTCVDAHCHTSFSDGASLRKILEKCSRRGIGVCITDHNQVKGAVEALKQKKVMVVPGIEVNTSEGPHFLAYFYSVNELKDFYYKNIHSKRFFNMKKFTSMADIKMIELVEKLEKYNCVKCLPHPHAPAWGNISRLKEKKEILRKVDAVEVISGLQTRNSNKKACETQMRHHKAVTAGSDAHGVMDVGNCLTLTKASNADEFLDAIRKKRTIAVGKEKLMQKAMQTTRWVRKDIRRIKTIVANKLFSRNDEMP